jgi:hypothetical protein
MSEVDEYSLSEAPSFKRTRHPSSERGEVVPAHDYDYDYDEDDDKEERDRKEDGKNSYSYERKRSREPESTRFFHARPQLSVQKQAPKRVHYKIPIRHTKDGWFSLRCPECAGYFCNFTDLAAVDPSGSRTIIQEDANTGQRIQTETKYANSKAAPSSMKIEHYMKCNNRDCGITFKMEFRQVDRNFMLTTKKIRF